MSTKINLLPDIKQAKIQEKDRRQLAVTVAIASVVISAAVLLVGFLIIQGQNLRISQLTNSIKNKKSQEASTPDVKTILSLQARAGALPNLYSQRAVMTKLFNVLAATVEPQDADYTNVNITGGTQMVITAEGKSYMAAARLAKALEAANVTLGNGASSNNTPYFTNVQLSAVTLTGNKTGYNISATINQGATSGQ